MSALKGADLVSGATDNEVREIVVTGKRTSSPAIQPAQVAFTVYGIAIPKARARVGRFGAFTPEKTRRWEYQVGLAATSAMRGRLQFLDAVQVKLEFILPIPGSWSVRKVQTALDGSIFPTAKPDLDNLVKSVTDACNEIVYRDDSQITCVKAQKRYGEDPMVIVTVEAAA